MIKGVDHVRPSSPLHTLKKKVVNRWLDSVSKGHLAPLEMYVCQARERAAEAPGNYLENRPIVPSPAAETATSPASGRGYDAVPALTFCILHSASGLMNVSRVSASVRFPGAPRPSGEVGLSGPGEGCRASGHTLKIAPSCPLPRLRPRPLPQAGEVTMV